MDKLLTDLDLPVTALFSTLPHRGAGLECVWAADKMDYFYNKLINNIRNGDVATANTQLWDPKTWPSDVKGVGFTEAPRGARPLDYIKDTRIENYQAVVPTTWNAGPRDNEANIGAYEASLMDTPMAIPDQPLEILRTIHSFDPCLACSTHVMSPDGDELADIKVRFEHALSNPPSATGFPRQAGPQRHRGQVASEGLCLRSAAAAVALGQRPVHCGVVCHRLPDRLAADLGDW